jgi:hypothetical protein
VRHQIIFLQKQGKNKWKIGKMLEISSTAVRYNIEKNENNRSVEDKYRSGMKKKVDDSADMFLKLQSLGNRASISSIFRWRNIPPFNQTSTFGKNGLKGCVAVKKPLLWLINKQKWLFYARKYRDSTLEDWNRVWWTDESMFE